MSSVGLIGLGAIGGNLALNLQRSRDVHVYGRTKEKVDAVANKSDAIHGHTDMDTFISEMDTPRTIFRNLHMNSIFYDRFMDLQILNAPFLEIST